VNRCGKPVHKKHSSSLRAWNRRGELCSPGFGDPQDAPTSVAIDGMTFYAIIKFSRKKIETDLSY